MLVRELGLQPYQPIWQAMKAFTLQRNETTPDELWLLEHFPVYTQGQAGKAEHILNPEQIPIIQTDRGGQVTYHGHGQLVAYVLMNLRRQQLGIRSLVCRLEDIIIKTLQTYQISAHTRCGAPGVYVADKKIASIGLRVKNGYTYHGIALNVNMNLQPFAGINPCGYAQLQMTQMADFMPHIKLSDVNAQFSQQFLTAFERENA